MRDKELSTTLAYLKRLLVDPRLGTAQREKLRRGIRELEKVRQSGKLDQDRLFRSVKLISSTLVEVVSEAEIPADTDVPTVAR